MPAGGEGFQIYQGFQGTVKDPIVHLLGQLCEDGQTVLRPCPHDDRPIRIGGDAHDHTATGDGGGVTEDPG